MLINVVYKNDRHDLVKPSLLQTLLDDDLVKQFHRCDGWVTIGVDHVRNMTTSPSFPGQNRRTYDETVAVPLRLLSTPFAASRVPSRYS